MTDQTAGPEPQDVARAQMLVDAYQKVTQELSKLIVGQEDVIEQLMIAILARGHCLLEGVPGLAKTLMVRGLSQVMELSFRRIQFTPDLMPSDITGTEVINEDATTGRRNLTFLPGPLFAQMILADEINRTPPKTQSSLLEAMQEHSVTVAGVVHPLPEPFFVLATQNPLEQEGTYPLPEAQLDRFMFKILVAPPSLEELGQIIDRTTSTASAQASALLDGARLIEMRQFLRGVPIAPHIRDYALKIVVATHADNEYATPLVKQFIRCGSSPRGAQSIVLAAKVLALLDGRYNVSYDDVTAVTLSALRHRMLLNFEGEAEGITTDRIIGEITTTLRELVPAGVALD